MVPIRPRPRSSSRAAAAAIAACAACGCLPDYAVGVVVTDGGGAAGAAGSAGAAGGDAAGNDADGGAGGSDATDGGCAIALAAGDDHACAVRKDGTLWCWGYDGFGQVGNGTVATAQDVPVQVSGLEDAVAKTAAGGDHTCAVTAGARLFCWGRNDSNQLGLGAAPGPQTAPVEVTALGAGVADVTAGGDHTCARKADGSVWCWGDDTNGQAGGGKDAGTIASPSEVVALGKNVVEVVAGGAHTCARKKDGSLWCWGRNDNGQVGNGSLGADVVAPAQVTALGAAVGRVAAGGAHTCAGTGGPSGWTAWCWGDGTWGQLGDGTTTGSQPAPVQVKTLGATVVALSARSDETCALRDGATAWCWGRNDGGKIGDGTSDPSKPAPVQVAGVGPVAEVAVGGVFACARLAGGALRCWGRNHQGELGDGTTDDPKPSPQAVLLPCP